MFLLFQHLHCKYVGTPVCRLCGRYLALLGRSIRVTVPAVTVAPTAMVGSLIRSSNLPHSLQRGVQSLLKVVIHGGGGATRPDLGRAVQFEGHWIARPNLGRQSAGGAAGAGAE